MKRLPRLALATALFAGALAGIPSLAFAGNLPAAIDGSVTVMHTNDIHGSYKYSYNASKGTGTVGFDGLAVLYSAQNSALDLLLDAGDTFHGQSFATMSEGKSIAELMDTFYADGYEERFAKGEPQRQLSKEFVREWLMEHGFSGKPGQQVPEMTDEFVDSVSDRYIELYEKITGERFVRDEAPDVLARLESNVRNMLARLH